MNVKLGFEEQKLGFDLGEIRMDLGFDARLVSGYVSVTEETLEKVEAGNIALLSVAQIERLFALYGLRMRADKTAERVETAVKFAKKMVKIGLADTVVDLQTIANMNRVCMNQLEIERILKNN